jgi:hypothetical protein
LTPHSETPGGKRKCFGRRVFVEWAVKGLNRGPSDFQAAFHAIERSRKKAEFPGNLPHPASFAWGGEALQESAQFPG